MCDSQDVTVDLEVGVEQMVLSVISRSWRAAGLSLRGAACHASPATWFRHDDALPSRECFAVRYNQASEDNGLSVCCTSRQD